MPTLEDTPGGDCSTEKRSSNRSFSNKLYQLAWPLTVWLKEHITLLRETRCSKLMEEVTPQIHYFEKLFVFS